jgi:FAD-dependent urate hydroxylase
VIGCGQSGLETAALLHEQGAKVRIIARSPIINWNPTLDQHRLLSRRIRYPDAGLGPGWSSLAYSELPHIFHRLPQRMRRYIVDTANGPSGAWWLKDRVAGKILVLTSSEVISAVEKGGRLQLLVRTDSESNNIQTDHVIAATGYRVNLNRLVLLEPFLAKIRNSAGVPTLNSVYESSIPNLHFIGLSSALSFGPVMRFVYGARHAAIRLTSHVRASRRASSALSMNFHTASATKE